MANLLRFSASFWRTSAVQVNNNLKPVDRHKNKVVLSPLANITLIQNKLKVFEPKDKSGVKQTIPQSRKLNEGHVYLQ
jgi:hypothetical protein